MEDKPVEDLTRVCPRCQAVNPSRSRFCLRCGSALTTPAPIVEQPAAPPEKVGADAAMDITPAAIPVMPAGDGPGIGARAATDDGSTRITFPGLESGPLIARRRATPARRLLPMLVAAVVVLMGAGLAAWLLAGGHPSHHAAPATPTAVPTPRPKATAVPVQGPGSWRIVPAAAPGHPPAAPPAGSYPIARAFGGYLAYRPPATIITPTNWPTFADRARHLTLAYPPGWRQVPLARGMGTLFLAPQGTASAALPGGLPGIALSWTSGARLPAAGDPALLDLGPLPVGHRTGHLYSIGGAGISALRLVIPIRAGTLTLYARADSPALLDDFWRLLATLRLE